MALLSGFATASVRTRRRKSATLGRRRLAENFEPSAMISASLLLSALAEAEQAEPSSARTRIAAAMRRLSAAVHVVRIGGGDSDPPRAETAQPVDDRLAHACSPAGLVARRRFASSWS